VTHGSDADNDGLAHLHNVGSIEPPGVPRYSCAANCDPSGLPKRDGSAERLQIARRLITNHGQRPWYEAGPPEGAVNVR
jgi:hypothetical protein